MSEDKNITEYKASMLNDDAAHWKRGELAAAWTTHYSRGRSDMEYAKLTGDSRQNINNHRRVFLQFAKRFADLKWSHYFFALEDCGTGMDAEPWLEMASENKWSVRELEQAIRDGSRKEQHAKAVEIRNEEAEECVGGLEDLIKKGRKFGCIYADPPWQYGNQGTRAATDNHYDTMPQDEIAALPVGELAAERCHLHLWTTNGFLKDALQLMEIWGFEFKSTFVWVKPQMGIGNYWRCSHEIMLLGVKGGMVFESKSLKSWIEADRTKHSAKPDIIRTFIEAGSPGPRLELFGREMVSGWTVWGNQIEKGLIA